MEAANQNDRPAFGTKEDLLGAPLEHEPVTINGKQYLARGLTATEETQIAKISGDEAKKHKLNAIVARLGTMLCTSDGQPNGQAFTESDESSILKMPGRDVRKLVDAVMKASGLDEKSRVDLGKGSAGIGSDVSSSG